ncbi:protease-4 [Nicoletella semolina]|uniref:Protease-4 n=1 Tax=Nicoletella semolina TaxID=271160 RepID=A0A4R2NBP6_9PAST|nr:signal peptide peptidase SppA [Nicoletella semolina]MDH2925039.1 signal peptide peptidase SppA [Nicoletella semolina]TCP18589.1 protease-4 [Nicoletella semolina]
MSALFKGIYRIYRCIRECVINLFFILFVLFCLSLLSFLQTSKPQKNTFDPNFRGALTLNLDGYLADNHDQFADFSRFVQSELNGTRQVPLKISTFDVVRAIHHAKTNDQITGLVLDLKYFEGGDFPSLEFIGKEIQYFKETGKPVIAIGEYYSQAQYYLASFADKIYLNKAGFVDLHGLSYSNLYFKTLFEKIEAIPHIFRVGTYKSAVEPFIRDDMSPEARQNAQLWLNTLWGNITQTIADNRQITPERVLPNISQYIDEYKQAKGDDGEYALARKLVTDLATNEQIHQALLAQFGKSHQGEYNHISFFEYLENLPSRFYRNASNKIAVINVEGEIVLGESSEDTAGSDTIVHLLRRANQDERVKGVILRINSPGGSAIASEFIRQEVENLQKAGKPVVASMGGMAASGGYWIAATANKIIASRSTLTGSIGIFGLAVSFEKTAKGIGVNQDGISTSKLAPLSLLKTLPKEQGVLIQISIENGYDRFLELVSRGRKMDKAAVDKIAQGQVWLGEMALKNGLVDKLGDFNDAYEMLVELLQAEQPQNASNYQVQWFIEEDESVFGQIMRDLKLQFKAPTLQALVSEWTGLSLSQANKPANLLSRFNDPKQTYLYCLNCGTIK